MNKLKLILLNAVLMVTAFTAVVYTSCKKDACSGVTCQNGGSCSGGNCTCPTGFYGNYCENTSISYTNDTYTPITITLNGVTQTIANGSTVSFDGVAGSTATVSAYTYGTTSSNTQLGEKITWSFTDNFSTDGSDPDEPLDAPNDVFYLEMVDNSATESITSITVNPGATDAVTDELNIPNNSQIYGVGYYPVETTGPTSIYVVGNTGGTSTFNLTIPSVANASTTATID